MQQFRVEVLVTINTVETVSAAEVKEAAQGWFEEDFPYGNAEVTDVREV